MADLTEAIEQAATTPASATQDGGTTVARSIPDLIAADQYLTAKQAVANRRRRLGIRYARIQNPGAV